MSPEEIETTFHEATDNVIPDATTTTTTTEPLHARKRQYQTSFRHFDQQSCHSESADPNMLFRYRADRAQSEGELVNDTETRVWHIFEHIFCFLKGMPVYYVRRRMMFIIILQGIVSSFRILPIIFGYSYQSTAPVFILYVTLIFGWHGVKYLIPKFLLFYKIGMQVSLCVDLLLYIQGWNGNQNTVSKGTAYYIQIFASSVLLVSNFVGLLFGWKLRRIVKGMQFHRAFERATMAEVATVSTPERPSLSGAGAGHSSFGASSSQSSSNNNTNRRLSAEVPSCSNESNNPDASKHSSNCSPPPRVIHVGEILPPVQEEKDTPGKEPEKLEPQRESFCPNQIVTSKYTYYNFLFVLLQLQLSRLANVYTTMIVFLCFFEFSPVSPVASLTPLLIVFATAAIKDVVEDLKRKREDEKVNSTRASITRFDPRTSEFVHFPDVTWKDICVGDYVHMKDGDEAPADIILMSTSRSDARCYIETANLDGETSMKVRQVPECTRPFATVQDLHAQYHVSVSCEPPNKSLFQLHGSLTLTPTVHHSSLEKNAKNAKTEVVISMDQMILRGSELRSSSWTLGLVVFTGAETRIALNSSTIHLKRSQIEKTLNTMFIVILVFLFIIAVACSVGNNDWKLDVVRNFQPYLQSSNPEDDAEYNNFVFLSYLILFNNMIPLSMYVTMEGVRAVYAKFIENDLEMYDAPTDTPARVRNSNIIEDLGQIQYIFSDKTGTLTKNEMIFAKCTVAGLKYGTEECCRTSSMGSEKERETRRNSRAEFEPSPLDNSKRLFYDPRLLSRLDEKHKSAMDIHHFLLALLLCNSVIPQPATLTDDEVNESSKSNAGSLENEDIGLENEKPENDYFNIMYKAASPDEQALVEAARDEGYVLLEREGQGVLVDIRGTREKWNILSMIEFTSDRKRMSVICQGPDGKIRLFTKGADNVIMSRLSADVSPGVCHVTVGHLKEYAAEGLRTLTVAMKELLPEECDTWKSKFHQASILSDENQRKEQLFQVAEDIEQNLHLLGATAIEDKLQDGVQDCIASLRQAGLNFWVLTGDKKETAVSVAMSSKVIDDSMDMIVLDQTDKRSLISELENLYLQLVEDKWEVKTEEKPFAVLWNATIELMLSSFRQTLSAMSGYRTSVNNKPKPPGRKHVRNNMLIRYDSSRGDDFDDDVEDHELIEAMKQMNHGSDSKQDDDGHLRLDFDLLKEESSPMYHHQSPAPYLCQNDYQRDEAYHYASPEPPHEPLCASSYPEEERAESVDEDYGSSSNNSSSVAEYAMVIDESTLDLLLDNDVKYIFLAVARECKSVICCRCSPFQKAEVVKLVTQPKLMWGPGHITLAIGDGANDVPMIQSANVGIGISGKEGRQAVLSSDYSLAQFRFLKRLLLVHGNFSYKRISKLILFSFMKNVALSISNFWFASKSQYSGLLMYFGVLFTLYNALFTTIPIVSLAIYSQDVSPAILMKHPRLYQNGLHGRSFNWGSFLGWCGLGVWHAWVIFIFPFTADGYFVNFFNGQTSFSPRPLGLWADGVAAYSYLVLASTVQVSLLTCNWTRAHVVAIGATVVFYFAFIWLLSTLYLATGVVAYESYAAAGIVQELFSTPWYWLGLALACVTAVLPNYILKAGRVLFYPDASHLIREWQIMTSTTSTTTLSGTTPKKSKMKTTTTGTVEAPESERALEVERQESFRDTPRPVLVRRNTGFAFSTDDAQPALFEEDASRNSIQ